MKIEGRGRCVAHGKSLRRYCSNSSPLMGWEPAAAAALFRRRSAQTLLLTDCSHHPRHCSVLCVGRQRGRTSSSNSAAAAAQHDREDGEDRKQPPESVHDVAAGEQRRRPPFAHQKSSWLLLCRTRVSVTAGMFLPLSILPLRRHCGATLRKGREKRRRSCRLEAPLPPCGEAATANVLRRCTPPQPNEGRRVVRHLAPRRCTLFAPNGKGTPPHHPQAPPPNRGSHLVAIAVELHPCRCYVMKIGGRGRCVAHGRSLRRYCSNSSPLMGWEPAAAAALFRRRSAQTLLLTDCSHHPRHCSVLCVGRQRGRASSSNSAAAAAQQDREDGEDRKLPPESVLDVATGKQRRRPPFAHRKSSWLLLCRTRVSVTAGMFLPLSILPLRRHCGATLRKGRERSSCYTPTETRRRKGERANVGAAGLRRQSLPLLHPSPPPASLLGERTPSSSSAADHCFAGKEKMSYEAAVAGDGFPPPHRTPPELTMDCRRVNGET
nr:hypothetical protein Iba_chr04bCG14420 [Ipomoea batatas]